MGDYRKLEVWRKAHALALFTYRATDRLPAQERYGLTSQMRRSAVSVASNIAEGAGRWADADMARFIKIALGSVNELQYQFVLAHDLGWISDDTFNAGFEQASEVRAMLDGLRRRLTRTPRRPAPPSELYRAPPSPISKL